MTGSGSFLSCDLFPVAKDRPFLASFPRFFSKVLHDESHVPPLVFPVFVLEKGQVQVSPFFTLIEFFFDDFCNVDLCFSHDVFMFGFWCWLLIGNFEPWESVGISRLIARHKLR